MGSHCLVSSPPSFPPHSVMIWGLFLYARRAGRTLPTPHSNDDFSDQTTEPQGTRDHSQDYKVTSQTCFNTTPKFHNQEPKDRQLSLQHQCIKIQKCPGWQPEHTKFQNTELALSKDYKNWMSQYSAMWLNKHKTLGQSTCCFIRSSWILKKWSHK